MKPFNGYDKNGKKINNNGGDKTDYMYDDNGKVISSTNVKISAFEGGELSSNMKGYGYRMRTIGSGGALYDLSMDMFQLYVGAGELKVGYGLIKMGVTNLSKAKLGIPILGNASKTVLESSLHYSKIYRYKKINLFGGAIKKLPYFTGVKADFVTNWASFYGRNAVWFGGVRAGVGNGIIYNATNK